MKARWLYEASLLYFDIWSKLYFHESARLLNILENFLSIFLANKEKNTKNPYQEAMDYYAQIDKERYGSKN